jgi:hypothetical protein
MPMRCWFFDHTETIPEEEIKGIESVLTIMAGRVVHGGLRFFAILKGVTFSQETTPWAT